MPNVRVLITIGVTLSYYEALRSTFNLTRGEFVDRNTAEWNQFIVAMRAAIV